MMNQRRQPAGSPEGGQWAGSTNRESDVSLGGLGGPRAVRLPRVRTPSETTPVYDAVRADLRRDPSEHARRAEHSYDALPSDIHRNVAADVYGTDFTPRHAQSVRGLSDLSLHQMHYANEVARRYPVPDPLERNIYMRQRIERETLTPPAPLRARLPEQR